MRARRFKEIHDFKLFYYVERMTSNALMNNVFFFFLGSCSTNFFMYVHIFIAVWLLKINRNLVKEWAGVGVLSKICVICVSWRELWVYMMSCDVSCSFETVCSCWSCLIFSDNFFLPNHTLITSSINHFQ